MTGTKGSVSDQLLLSGKYADIRVTCGAYTFHVHKPILEKSSDFFKAVFRNDCKENAEGIVNLPENDPFVIGQLLSFMYQDFYNLKGPSVNYTCAKMDAEGRTKKLTRELSRTGSGGPTAAERLKYDIDMYMAGNQYGGLHLMEEASEEALLLL